MTARPVADKHEDAFLAWYGTMLLERARGAKTVSIEDDHDLLRSAFRDGWSWGRRERAEELKLLAEAITFGLFYFDYDEDHDAARAIHVWQTAYVPALTQDDHSGDCTNECHSCLRCQAEHVLEMVADFTRALEEEK